MTLALTIGGRQVVDLLENQSLELRNAGYSQAGTLSFVLTGLSSDFITYSDYQLEDGSGDYQLESGVGNLQLEVNLGVVEEAPVLLNDDVSAGFYRLEDNSGDYRLEDGTGNLVLETQILFAGLIRNLKRVNYSLGSHVRYLIDCQDYTTLAADNVITTAGISGVIGTDRARIADLFASFGTKGIVIGIYVQTLVSSMPQQNYQGKTLAEALDMILAISGGAWYVDYSKQLHTFLGEPNTAPFGLSDGFDGVTTYGYTDLVLPSETTQLHNAVYMIPGGAPAVATWYTSPTSIIAYGRREASVTMSDITLQADLDTAGAGYLVDHAFPVQTGSLVCYQPGLAAGMMVAITSANHNLVASQFRITTVDTTYRTQSGPLFRIEFGTPRRTLAQELADMQVAN